MPTAPLRRQAFQMLVLCTVFWAFSFPVMKTLLLTQQAILPGAGSWFLSSLCVTARFLLGGALLLLVFFPEVRTVSRRELEQGLWLAGLLSAAVCLQMDGLAYIPASTSAFLSQLYCVLIPLWVAVSRRRMPSLKIILCCVAVVVGTAMLMKLNPLSVRIGRGELETLASSVLFTGQILCLELPRFQGNRPRCFTTVMLLASGLFSAPLVAATAPNLAACFRAYFSLTAFALLVVLILVCTVTTFLLMNRWQREVTATEAGLIYCVEPVFVSVLALFLPGSLSRWAGVDYANEHATLHLVLGGGLITAANILLHAHWLKGKRAVAVG